MSMYNNVLSTIEKEKKETNKKEILVCFWGNVRHPQNLLKYFTSAPGNPGSPGSP